MKTSEELKTMARRISLDEVTRKEVDIAIIQLLTSMYNENQRDREHLNRIEEKIDAYNKTDCAEHIKMESQLTNLIDKVDYHDFIIKGLMGFASIASGYAIIRILTHLFE
jgi:hypothetical protein